MRVRWGERDRPIQSVHYQNWVYAHHTHTSTESEPLQFLVRSLVFARRSDGNRKLFARALKKAARPAGPDAGPPHRRGPTSRHGHDIFSRYKKPLSLNSSWRTMSICTRSVLAVFPELSDVLGHGNRS